MWLGYSLELRVHFSCFCNSTVYWSESMLSYISFFYWQPWKYKCCGQWVKNCTFKHNTKQITKTMNINYRCIWRIYFSYKISYFLISQIIAVPDTFKFDIL